MSMLKGTKGQSKEVVRYSESFKLQVIRELEDGVHLSSTLLGKVGRVKNASS